MLTSEKQSFSRFLLLSALHIHFFFPSVASTEGPLRLRVLEFDKSSGKLVQVLTSRNSDVIYGEHVSEQSFIVLECRGSEGPIQLKYSGDGEPAFTIGTNTTRSGRTLYFWTFLAFDNAPIAEHTGNYTCSSSNSPDLQTSVYLYVPVSRSAVFVPTRVAKRLEFAEDKHVHIPCPVIHPNAKVNLEIKSQASTLPNVEISYNPKTGFSVPVSVIESGGTSTTFVCNASFRGRRDSVEYEVFSRLVGPNVSSGRPSLPPSSTPQPSSHAQSSSGLRSACHPTLCGASAECVVIDYAAHCVCMEGFIGDPWTRCRSIPSNHQLQQINAPKNPCSPNPCLDGKSCVVINRHPVCTCEGDHQGIPTVCRPKPTAHLSVPPNTDIPLPESQRKPKLNAGQILCQASGNRCQQGSVNIARSCKVCGENSVCTITDSAIVCECALNATGIPPNCRTRMQKGQLDLGCRSNIECPPNNVCDGNGKCVTTNFVRNEDVHSCTINCGKNTVCRRMEKGELALSNKDGNRGIEQGVYSECKCMNGYEGNPYAVTGCTQIVTTTDPCNPSPCGENSFCRSHREKAFCSCDFNSAGRPPTCRKRCSRNSECNSNYLCISGLCLPNN